MGGQHVWKTDKDGGAASSTDRGIVGEERKDGGDNGVCSVTHEEGADQTKNVQSAC